MKNIIGITAFYHDSSVCLLQDGKIIAASLEERFTRKKNDSTFPIHALDFCLKKGNITLGDIDLVCFYENPSISYQRDKSRVNPNQLSENIILQSKYQSRYNLLKHYFPNNTPIFFSNHHLSHAANAVYYNDLKDCACLVIDAVGEDTTMWLGEFRDGEFKRFSSVLFPHSLGLVYSSITSLLGFQVNRDEYKVMGLAAYGENSYRKQLNHLFKTTSNNCLELDLKYFDFQNFSHKSLFNENLNTLLGIETRLKNSEIEKQHEDLARSMQTLLEDIVLEKIRWLESKTDLKSLCISGGVALNCLANQFISENSSFDEVFIPPSPGDGGSAIGAAVMGAMKNGVKIRASRNNFLGFSEKGNLGDYEKYFSTPKSLTAELAKQLSVGKVIAIFRDQCEFGPRALGNRSILANPAYPDIQDHLNKKIKFREKFRPFAPIVRIDEAKNFFHIDEESEYMTKTFRANEHTSKILNGCVHIDNTSRVQTVSSQNHFLYNLLGNFKEISGSGVLINTSFNLNNEPIVNSALDSLICFLRSEIDCLVINDKLLKRSNLPEYLQVHARKFYLSRHEEKKKNVYEF